MLSRCVVSQVKHNSYFLVGLCLGLWVSLAVIPLEEEPAACSAATGGAPAPAALGAVAGAPEEFEPHHEEKPLSAGGQAAGRSVQRPRYYSTELGMRGTLLTGVLSSEEALKNQVPALNRTAARLQPSLKFFITASAMSTVPGLANVVGFTDTREMLKPFHALKYLADNYLEEYDFFFLVSDTAYINTRRLTELVSKLSVSQDVYMGTIAEDDSHYCSLESGILLSNSVLRAVHGALDWCVRNSYSPHHHENIGRCVLHAAHLSCAPSLQAQHYESARAPPPAAPHPAPHPAAPPNVELFVRTAPQNMLASVNNAIIIEYDHLHHGKLKDEQKETTNHVEALNRKKERIFRSSVSNEERSNALPPPSLPELHECFDVYIAMAANPWNFVIQPNNTRPTLQTMMSTLQTECPKLSEQDAPTKPVNGELYTAFYDKDSSWYRVLIAGVVSTEMVTVYFCDYGDLALFSSKDLRPVPPGAPLARSLPPQAIKARLFGVWPLHQDWTVEDCIRFQELCVEQQFVGICKEVGKDPLNPSEPLLTLDLIDTSTDEDVYLNKQLVSEGRARLTPDS